MPLLPLLGVAILIYVGYCVYHGGMYHRGKGWRTKDEAPGAYRFGTITLTLCGLWMICGPLIMLGKDK